MGMQQAFKYYYKIIIRHIWRICNFWRFKELGNKSFICKPIKITPSCIICKKNVKINNFARVEGVFQYNLKTFNPIITLNNNVSIQQNLHLTCANSITIGEGTAIGANVTITDIHHRYDNITIAIEMQDIEVSEVVIGKNCKIYNNAVICPGCNIGNHVTIGANSVVTKDIPSYSVAIGAPARVIKRYNFENNSWQKTRSDGSFL